MKSKVSATQLIRHLIYLIAVVRLEMVNSHGRLMNPPARNCMWRFGFPNPVNYNDNEVFCGGFNRHQSTNKGKCGVCGDEYSLPTPRPHEIGGIYGNGVISRHYFMEQDITVKIDLTTNHLGYFEFRICPVTNNKEVTQECLNRNLLKVINEDGSSSKKFKIQSYGRSGSFSVQVRLPPYMVCQRCVLQWTYRTGNTWGPCSDGSYQLGCGPQETFINCADIAISPNHGYYNLWLDRKLTSSSRSNPHMLYYLDTSKENTPLTPLVINYQLCTATKAYEIIPGIDDWCQTNCMRYPPNCPSDICRCIKDCEAIGEFKKMKGSDHWCLEQCSVYPPKNCSAERCQCW